MTLGQALDVFARETSQLHHLLVEHGDAQIAGPELDAYRARVERVCAMLERGDHERDPDKETSVHALALWAAREARALRSRLEG